MVRGRGATRQVKTITYGHTTLAKEARKQLFRSVEATTPVAQRSASGRALDGGPGRFLTSEHLEGASLNLLHTRDLKFHLSSLDIQVR